jgi:hypothetical protein
LIVSCGDSALACSTLSVNAIHESVEGSPLASVEAGREVGVDDFLCPLLEFLRPV